MDIAVETFNLTKSYGSTNALDGLNTKVRQGEILVLLGPNGSGKTTLLHLLATVLRPTRGTATVMGYDIVKQPLKVREAIGIAFQEPRGFWRHKPYHILSFHAGIYGLKGEAKDKIVDQTLKDFDLWPSRNKRFMELSGGQGKRLEVAKLFVFRPQVAVFDEPTAMVDLEGKRMIWDRIRDLRKAGSTVIVATNEVREAEYLADRISIMKAGKEVVTEDLRTLKDSISGGDVVEVQFSTPASAQLLHAIEAVPGTVRVVQDSENALKVFVNRSEDWLPQMMTRVQSLQTKVTSIRVAEPSLDDVFLHYTGDELANQINA
ncbi:MAG TPA: ATP-binding cassette domain-containing protein [Nitrososphaerales archaeon]|nr:ATP-binding cassette domain-containing protein [Nitrososphaerales archaeon]